MKQSLEWFPIKEIRDINHDFPDSFILIPYFIDSFLVKNKKVVKRVFDALLRVQFLYSWIYARNLLFSYKNILKPNWKNLLVSKIKKTMFLDFHFSADVSMLLYMIYSFYVWFFNSSYWVLLPVYQTFIYDSLKTDRLRLLMFTQTVNGLSKKYHTA